MNSDRVDVRGGLVWLVVGLVVGGVVLALEPFGTVDGKPWESSGWVPGNGYLLAFAPLLAIIRAYRHVRATPYSPRGVEARRTIGGRWMLGTCAIHATGPAAAFVWGDDRLLFGGVLTALFAISWLAFVEVQRQTRVPLAFGTWTSREIDRLRVNPEVFAIAVIWIAAASVYEALSPSSIAMTGYIIGAGALGVGVAFISVVADLARQGSPTGLAAVAYILGAAAAAAVVGPAIWEPYLIIGVPIVALLLERARRRQQRAIAKTLAASGHQDDLRSRYATEFDPSPLMPPAFS